jgi:hypothetical protein
MKPLKIGKHLTLEVGDFIIIADNNNTLSFGWYCGEGRYNSSLQYYSLWAPGASLKEYEQYERGEPISSYIADRFKKNKGFTSKCFYKSYINSYYESRILKPANPDELFTHPKDIEQYNKSKEALVRIKFLNK